MELFLKRCTLAALFTLTLTPTVRAAEPGSSAVSNTYQGQTQSTQLAEYTESAAEQPRAEMAIVPQRRFNTLSGESLHGTESRNLSKDFTSLSSTTSTVSESMPIFLSRMNGVPTVQIPAVLEELGKKIEFDAGDSSVDSNQIVKVQYHLNSTK